MLLTLLKVPRLRPGVLGLLLGLIFTACTGCDLGLGEKPIETPKITLEITFDRDWTFNLPRLSFSGMNMNLLSSKTYFNNAGEWIGSLDLTTGTLDWEHELIPTQEENVSFALDNSFIAGNRVFSRVVRNMTFNSLGCWELDGTFVGYVYLALPGYEGDYKNPIHSGLLANRQDYDWPTAHGTRYYWSSMDPQFPDPLYPDKNPDYFPPEVSGGLMTADLSDLRAGLSPGEFYTPVNLLFPRTDNRTLYTNELEFFTFNSREYAIFGEGPQRMYPIPLIPGKTGADSVDWDKLRPLTAIHCIDIQTGEELWMTRPRAMACDFSNALFIKGDKLLVVDQSHSGLFNLYDGTPIYETTEDIGDDLPVGHTIDGNTLYLNKFKTNDPHGLEAVDWTTGKRLWATRINEFSQGMGVAYKDGLLYVVEQRSLRIYNASTGEYLAQDPTITPMERVLYIPFNQCFVYGDNYIIFGSDKVWSVKMNYYLDIFGKLQKRS